MSRTDIFKKSSPPEVRVINMSKLDGGLNLWELDYRLPYNQSPNALNMYWRDGALSSRRGQNYIGDEVAPDPIVASYERLFHGYGIFHAGDKLYKLNVETGEITELLHGLNSTVAGTFFVFGKYLYYKTAGCYLRVDDKLIAEMVEGYIPILVINLSPDGTGGSLYQAENRISRYKIAKYTADGTSKKYVLPIKDLDLDFTPEVTVNDVEVTDFTYNAEEGTVTFSTAPTQSNPIVNNNVVIKFAKTDTTAKESIMSCPYAATYGSTNDVCVVMGGSSVQPNSYLWSGVNLVSDPTYFPTDYYNLAGQSDEMVTGFAKQQGMLIIFKERSIGKTSFSTAVIDGMTSIALPYTNINSNIGCDLPRTIQLVTNNLVFANSYGGVHILMDTSDANENNVIRISRNINGGLGIFDKKGLLYDVSKVAASAITSVDDDTRYWLCVGDNTYLWDYTVSNNVQEESSLSWFKFNNIKATAWIKTTNDIIYGSDNGRFTMFNNDFNDYGEPIERVYEFAVQNFGTYEVLKDIEKVIFVTRTDEATYMDITYKTDYGTRMDLTPIISMSYKLVPRNLAYRMLEVVKYAKVSVRKPRAFHVRHFSIMLTNNEKDSGMSLVSAQIFYHIAGEDR